MLMHNAKTRKTNNAYVLLQLQLVLLRSHFFQRRSISIRFLKKIAISIGFDFHTGPVSRLVVLNTSGGPGVTLDRRVTQLSAQLLLPPRVSRLS